VVWTGIAVDWLADNLYWTDYSLNQVWMSRADGLFQKVIARNLSGPCNIVVDQTRKCDRLRIAFSVVESTFITNYIIQYILVAVTVLR